MIRKRFLGFFVVLLAYCAIRHVKHSPSLPSVYSIATSLFRILESPVFYENLLYTLKIVSSGILISFVVGFILAVCCSMSPLANGAIMPIINTIKNIPSIALFPLFIILMGIGDEPRIFVIVWNSIYPIISSTMYGLNSVDEDIVNAALNCGAEKRDLYLYIKIPLSFVNVLEGLKISAGSGFIAIVVAEMLGATKGLGYMILWSANSFKYPDMYCYVLIIALIGLTINVVIEKIISLTERKMYYEKTRNRRSCGNGTFIDSFCRRDEVCRPKGL